MFTPFIAQPGAEAVDELFEVAFCSCRYAVTELGPRFVAEMRKMIKNKTYCMVRGRKTTMLADSASWFCWLHGVCCRFDKSSALSKPVEAPTGWRATNPLHQNPMECIVSDRGALQNLGCPAVKQLNQYLPQGVGPTPRDYMQLAGQEAQQP